MVVFPNEDEITLENPTSGTKESAMSTRIEGYPTSTNNHISMAPMNIARILYGAWTCSINGKTINSAPITAMIICEIDLDFIEKLL